MSCPHRRKKKEHPTTAILLFLAKTLDFFFDLISNVPPATTKEGSSRQNMAASLGDLTLKLGPKDHGALPRESFVVKQPTPILSSAKSFRVTRNAATASPPPSPNESQLVQSQAPKPVEEIPARPRIMGLLGEALRHETSRLHSLAGRGAITPDTHRRLLADVRLSYSALMKEVHLLLDSGAATAECVASHVLSSVSVLYVWADTILCPTDLSRPGSAVGAIELGCSGRSVLLSFAAVPAASREKMDGLLGRRIETMYLANEALRRDKKAVAPMAGVCQYVPSPSGLSEAEGDDEAAAARRTLFEFPRTVSSLFEEGDDEEREEEEEVWLVCEPPHDGTELEEFERPNQSDDYY